ncbi:aldehyde dehydrogenase family protein [Streptomyces iakyrus]|uniref:aldehyde dehydrogenase family protein n=1 Tax=Streptomyces iakyrus TaxID=68219 RepID=UPI0036E61A1C
MRRTLGRSSAAAYGAADHLPESRRSRRHHSGALCTALRLSPAGLWPGAVHDPSRVRICRIADTDVPQVTAGLVEDDRIAAVTLTGSNRAGAAVGAAAGRAAKKSVLELDGSDAFVVLADADVDLAAAAAVSARSTNSGQSCVCAKRFVVHEAVAEDFTTAFVRGVESLRMGDPRELSTQVGPLGPGRPARGDGAAGGGVGGGRGPLADRGGGRCRATGTSSSRPYWPAPVRVWPPSARRPSAPWPP